MTNETSPVGRITFEVTTLNDAIRQLYDRLRHGLPPVHIHLANAYNVYLADRSTRYRQIFSAADSMNLPDGRWVTIASRLLPRRPALSQVRGPSFFLAAFDNPQLRTMKHFLLGGKQSTLAALERALVDRYPDVNIVGSYSPPFRDLTEDDFAYQDELISSSHAQVVWVGLGTPKQDFEAQRLVRSTGVTAVAVGAAFDFAAGSVREAPVVMRRVGLEWLYRLITEPRRLWKRYLLGNLGFVMAALRSARTGGNRQPVVVVSQLPPPVHGSTVMTARLVASLDRLQYHPRLVDRRFSREIGEVGSGSARKLILVPSLLARFAKALVDDRDAPVIYFLTNRPGSFIVDWFVTAIAFALKRRVVLYIHTVGYGALADRSKLWSVMLRSVFARAAVTVVLGESLLADVVALGATTVRVVPNSVEDEAGTPSKRSRVLFLSNLLPEKGVFDFVELSRRLGPGRDEKYVIAGAAPDASVLNKVTSQLRAAQLNDVVEVVGAVGQVGRSNLLASSKVFVFPSTYRFEAQPLVLLEALSAGVPVVAYDVGGIRDIVHDAVNGFVVPPGDFEQLVARVEKLLVDERLRRSLAEGARSSFERLHSIESFDSNWSAVLEGALGHG
jgi:exopolysaccharide biosynthesis WecB/TagA/CpsF family protein